MELIYFRKGYIPDLDKDFYNTVIEASQLYKRIILDPLLLKKGASTLIKELPKIDKPHESSYFYRNLSLRSALKTSFAPSN